VSFFLLARARSLCRCIFRSERSETQKKQSVSPGEAAYAKATAAESSRIGDTFEVSFFLLARARSMCRCIFRSERSKTQKKQSVSPGEAAYAKATAAGSSKIRYEI